MIYYFSGTGNSKFVAKRLASKLNESTLDLGKVYRNHLAVDFSQENRLIFVYPTYAGRMPLFLKEYLLKQQFKKDAKAYFVTTCGMSGGNQYKNLEHFCKQIEVEYVAFYWVVMPENYIAMFKAPNKEEANRIIENALPKIDDIAIKIESETKSKHITGCVSSIYNNCFYKFVVKSKHFAVQNNCIGCGKCADSCVMKNITLVNNKPEWNDGCTHCMACINICPTQAIEYGKGTINKNRYYLKSDD